MSSHLKSLGLILLQSFHYYKARKRSVAEYHANMSHEQLQEHLRIRKELQDIKERQRDFLLRHRPPGAMF